MLIIKVQNDSTGTNEASNYRYQVMINETVIESGSIKKHDRRDGWQKLVGMLLAESYISAKNVKVQATIREADRWAEG